MATSITQHGKLDVCVCDFSPSYEFIMIYHSKKHFHPFKRATNRKQNQTQCRHIQSVLADLNKQNQRKLFDVHQRELFNNDDDISNQTPIFLHKFSDTDSVIRMPAAGTATDDKLKLENLVKKVLRFSNSPTISTLNQNLKLGDF